MTVWDFIWVAFGWGALVILVIGFLILAFAALATLWGILKSAFKPKQSPLTRQRHLQNAEARAISLYRGDEALMNAYLLGATYTWDLLHLKK